jgi:uncharacterized protein YndB with AHSA1/START domain
VANIVHEFFVKAQPERVFPLVATPQGLDKWWTKESSGDFREGGSVRLIFGPDYLWEAKVTRCATPSLLELKITQADPDWDGTLVGFELASEKNGATRVRFYHTGWPEENAHWRISNFCWAMYLRILRRNVEYGDTVPYERRLDV